MYKIVNAVDPSCGIGDTRSRNVIELLKCKWDEIHDEGGVFRYKIDRLEEKYVDKYLIQLNPDRGTKRRTPEMMNSIREPFDKSKFNFTKVSANEILFSLIEETNDSDIHSIVINASPISRYHALLCPSLSQCLSQVITEDSLVLALDVMFLSQNRDLRIGFNSLRGMASVNHLHYHLFLEPKTLPVETAKCKHLKGPIFRFEDYVVPAFCFQIRSRATVRAFSKEIFKLFSYLLSNSIAHNLFITRGECLVPGGDESLVPGSDRGKGPVPGDNIGKDPVPGDDRGKGPVPGDDRGKDPVPGDDIGKGLVPGDDRGKGPVPGDDRGKDPVPGDDIGKGLVPGDDRGKGPVPGDDIGKGLVPGDDRGKGLVPEDDEGEVVRVIVWPRRSDPGAKKMGAFNVAVCELAGWFPVYDKSAYETLSAVDYEQALKKWSLDDSDVFQDVETMF